MILHRSVSGGSTTRVSCLQTQTHILLLLSSILGPRFWLPAPHIFPSLCLSITIITAVLETCPWYGPSESRCLGRSKRCQVWRLIFKVFMATAPIKRTRCGEARPCSGGGRRVTAADGRISTQQLSRAARRRAVPVYADWTITTITGLCYVLWCWTWTSLQLVQSTDRRLEVQNEGETKHEVKLSNSGLQSMEVQLNWVSFKSSILSLLHVNLSLMIQKS